MKRITLSILLLLSMLSFGQSVSVTVTELKVLNLAATTVNFGTNVTSVNVSITASVSTSYTNNSQGSIMVYYQRNSSVSYTPIIPTNGYDGNFFLTSGSNGSSGTKTFKITLSRSEFDNTGGIVYVEYHPNVSNLLAYKSSNINVTKIPDPISNNIISGNQTIYEGQSVSMISGATPLGGNGTFTYAWQQKVGNGSWTTISGATSINYSPGTPAVTTSYRRIVSSTGVSNGTSNEVMITVIPVAAIQNNTIILNENTILGSLPTGGTGTYRYVWMLSGGEESILVPNDDGQNLELPSWIHNDLYEGININYGLYIIRYVTSGNKTVASNSVRIPLLNSNRMSSNEANIQSDLPEEELMTVYPNPTSESVNFSTNFSTDKQIEIVVYSEKSGNEKSVFKGTVNPSQVVNWKIPSSYQKGLYFYKILSDNKEVKTGKIIFK
jgi:hypothetical protein